MRAVPVRIVITRVPRDAGQRGRFGDGEIADVLSKVSLSGLAEPVNAETATLPKADLVAVVCEDFLLGKLLFELESDHHLSGFALPVLALIEPEFARKLHAERGSAFLLS